MDSMPRFPIFGFAFAAIVGFAFACTESDPAPAAPLPAASTPPAPTSQPTTQPTSPVVPSDAGPSLDAAADAPPPTGRLTKRLGWPSTTPSSIAKDFVGNVYIAGITRDDIDGAHAGNGDAFVAKINGGSLNVLWAKRMGTPGPEGSTTSRAHVAVGPTGNVFLAFTTRGSFAGADGGGEERVVLQSYNSSGAVRAGFPVELVNPRGAGQGTMNLAVDIQDNVWLLANSGDRSLGKTVAFRAFVHGYTGDGLQRFAPVDVSGTMAAADEDHFAGSLRLPDNTTSTGSPGDLFVMVGSRYASGSGPRRGLVSSLTTAGVPRVAEAGLAWPIELTTGAADAIPSSLSVDPTGNVFVLGTTGAATSTVWSFTESGANRAGFPLTVTLPSATDTRVLVHAGDVTGNLYFLGESSGDLGPTKVGARDLVVTAVNPSGTSRGGYPVQFGSAGNDVPSALVIDLVGRGFATGVLDDDADTSEGRDVFVHRFPSN